METSKANSIKVESTSTEPLLYTSLAAAAQEDEIVTDALDYKHRPAIRSKHGQWLSASFIIWVEMAERIAYYGISGNLISFLTGPLRQSTAIAASNVTAWSGAGYLLSILGAVIADFFLGKYYTLVASSVIYIVGLGLLTFSAILPSLGCDNQETSIEGSALINCSLNFQTTVFFFALYMVAVGQGGHKPCVQAFGADQFDEKDPEESRAKSSFFNWWFFGICTALLFGIGVMSYVQDNLSWALGFGIPCIVMSIGLLIFLLGTITYRFNVKNEGQSSLIEIKRAFHVVTTHKNDATLPMIGYQEDEQVKFIDKALDASTRGGKACSRSEMEEAKALIRLFPVWATTQIFAIVFSQRGTLFTKQGVTLDRSIGPNFAIPAAALQSFTAICIVLFIPIYDKILVPFAKRLTGKPSGITMLQRIGTGLFISIITMIVAAITEKKRLESASWHGLIDLPNATIPMSIWWLLPQYALFGVSEVFTMVGLQEFFYDQVSNELRSIGLSLYLSIFGLGNLLSSFLVSVINKATSSAGGDSWFSDNLNRAHLDYFYWLLAGLSAVGLAVFVYFANSYIYNKKQDSSIQDEA